MTAREMLALLRLAVPFLRVKPAEQTGRATPAPRPDTPKKPATATSRTGTHPRRPRHRWLQPQRKKSAPLKRPAAPKHGTHR
jgi:hypothetical protein